MEGQTTRWERFQIWFKDSWIGIIILALVAIMASLSQIIDFAGKVSRSIRSTPAAQLLTITPSIKPLDQYRDKVVRVGSDTVYPGGAVFDFNLTHDRAGEEVIIVDSIDVRVDAFDPGLACPFALTGDRIFGHGFAPVRVFTVYMTNGGVNSVQFKPASDAPMKRGNSSNLLATGEVRLKLEKAGDDLRIDIGHVHSRGCRTIQNRPVGPIRKPQRSPDSDNFLGHHLQTSGGSAMKHHQHNWLIACAAIALAAGLTASGATNAAQPCSARPATSPAVEELADISIRDNAAAQNRTTYGGAIKRPPPQRAAIDIKRSWTKYALPAAERRDQTIMFFTVYNQASAGSDREIINLPFDVYWCLASKGDFVLLSDAQNASLYADCRDRSRATDRRPDRPLADHPAGFRPHAAGHHHGAGRTGQRDTGPILPA